MEGWYQSDVLTTAGWTPALVTPLVERAADYKRSLKVRSDPFPPTGLTCLTMFFEPSTRTRLSFEAAALQLGVKVLSVGDADVSSSVRKGETLEDMGRVISAYADLVVIRHGELRAPHRLASTATVPVINAGDGAGEHPTQTLVDLFTIREVFGKFEGLRVGLCGDLRYGRTIHSLLGPRYRGVQETRRFSGW